MVNKSWVALAALVILFGSLQWYTYNDYQKKLYDMTMSYRRTSTSGIVLGGNAYFGLANDPAGTIDLTPQDVNFGALVYQGTSTISFYIVNAGKPMKSIIYWDTLSWTPNTPNDLILTWDLGDYTITTGEVKKVTVTLKLNSVLGNSPGPFTFIMHIDANIVGSV